MRLTPLEIQKHQFRRTWKGYDPDEVDAYLEHLAEDYESLVHELEAMREMVRGLETRVKQLSSNEDVLRQTLVTAQAMSEDLKKTALKESEILLGEAEVRAEKIMDAAHRRAAKLAQDIRDMKSLRSSLAGAIRSVIETHLGLLDSLAEVDVESPAEDKIAYLTPPPRVARGGEGA
jgi:cell division initiation protein